MTYTLIDENIELVSLGLPETTILATVAIVTKEGQINGPNDFLYVYLKSFDEGETYHVSLVLNDKYVVTPKDCCNPELVIYTMFGNDTLPLMHKKLPGQFKAGDRINLEHGVKLNSLEDLKMVDILGRPINKQKGRTH